MTFRIKKYKDLYVASNDTPTVNLKIGGEFKLVLSDINGRVVQETDWFSNLITNVGLPQMINWANASQYFFIGDNNTAPSFTDTALFGFLASTITNVGGSNSNLGLPNYEWTSIKGRRFNAGQGTGTIREVGIGLSNAQSNNTMVVRSLVTPEVTKAADQVLDVYYRFTVFPDLTDNSGQITIDGELYDWTTRVGQINQATQAYLDFKFETYFYSALYSGSSLGTITQLPTGTVDYPGAISNVYFDPNGVTGTQYVGLGSGNTVGAAGINGALAYFFYPAGIQAHFSRVSDGAGIFKDNTQTLTLTWRCTWSRH